MESLLAKIEMSEYTQKLYSEGEATRTEVLSSLKDVIDELAVVAKELNVEKTGEFKDLPQEKVEQLRKLNIRTKVLKANALEIAQNTANENDNDEDD